MTETLGGFERRAVLGKSAVSLSGGLSMGVRVVNFSYQRGNRRRAFRIYERANLYFQQLDPAQIDGSLPDMGGAAS